MPADGRLRRVSTFLCVSPTNAHLCTKAEASVIKTPVVCPPPRVPRGLPLARAGGLSEEEEGGDEGRGSSRVPGAGVRGGWPGGKARSVALDLTCSLPSGTDLLAWSQPHRWEGESAGLLKCGLFTVSRLTFFPDVSVGGAWPTVHGPAPGHCEVARLLALVALSARQRWTAPAGPFLDPIRTDLPMPGAACQCRWLLSETFYFEDLSYVLKQSHVSLPLRE